MGNGLAPCHSLGRFAPDEHTGARFANSLPIWQNTGKPYRDIGGIVINIGVAVMLFTSRVSMRLKPDCLALIIDCGCRCKANRSRVRSAYEILKLNSFHKLCSTQFRYKCVRDALDLCQ